ncbi:MAG: kinase/pyrophosphorylase [Bdellovibrionaceae bacterium]|nr:kinase/pyrophosphorylase [Pseudobdellovibrionaceae bacterium]MDW8190051.1 pyruvate, water dikinase regulatory protein [Pseudobdellovibrionaceae bacterium]
MKPNLSDYFIHVISDGTGETAIAVLKAALVHHSQLQIHILRHKNVRTVERATAILEDAEKAHSLVVYTIVNPSLRDFIYQNCNSRGIPSLDLLGPVFDCLNSFLGVSASEQKMEAGKLRVVDENYFKRIAAIEFAVKHDDGKNLSGLAEADIILVGISRTSKTPLSIFLSHKGYKVANVPIILNQVLPKEIEQVDQRKIVGLSIDIDNLKKIRQNRISKLGLDSDKEYATLQHILQEIQYAENIFKSHKRWPVIDVTYRALEEIAAEIISIVGSRMGWKVSLEF